MNDIVVYSEDGQCIESVNRNFTGRFVVDKQVKVIGSGAFAGCSMINEIVLPEQLQTIEDGAFYNCKNLKEITLPPSVESIGRDAFHGCEALKNINLNDELKYIDDEAFNNCISLSHITIPNNLDDYGIKLFNGCSNLKSISISANVCYLNASFFEGCDSLELIIVDPENRHFSFYKGALYSHDGSELIYGLSGCIEDKYFIPEGVETILNKAFIDCDCLETLILPSSIENIEYGALSNCKKLKNIEVAKNASFFVKNGILYKDYGHTLYYCFDKENITEYTVTKDITHIEDGAFYGCTGLKKVIFESCLLKLSDSLFEKCINLKEVILPDYLEIIGNKTFKHCSSLETISLPPTLSSIGEWAFAFCRKLQINLPDELERIKMGAFMMCESLIKIVLPTSLHNIEDVCFADCINLVDVDFHDDIESIGREAFACCSSLKQVDLPLNLTYIGGGAFMQTALSSLAIPEKVKKIDDCAFAFCPMLEMIVLPHDIEGDTESILYESNKVEYFKRHK